MTTASHHSLYLTIIYLMGLLQHNCLPVSHLNPTYKGMNNLQADEPLPKPPKPCSSDKSHPPLPKAPIPTRPKQHFKSEGKKCCHLLDQIQQLTFVIKHQEALASLYKELSSPQNDIQQYKPSKDGPVLEAVEGTSTSCNETVSSKACSAIEKRCSASLLKRLRKRKYWASLQKRCQELQNMLRSHACHFSKTNNDP